MKKILKVAFFPIFFIILALILCSIAITNRYYENGYKDNMYKVKIIEITDIKTNNLSNDTSIIEETIYFKGKILEGSEKGNIIDCYESNVYSDENVNDRTVSKGDIIYVDNGKASSDVKTFITFYKVPGIVLLLAIFSVVLLIFGKINGLKTIMTLLLTCIGIFGMLIPAILSGKNIFVWLFISVTYIIFSTLLILNNISKKSFAAIVSCMVSSFIVFLLSMLFFEILHLNGITSQDAIYLKIVVNSINFKDICIAGVVLCSVGAIMDVAVELSASLYELYEKASDNSPKSLIKSGFTIGRDMIGTMSNTLIMACIGCDLITFLIMARRDYTISMLLSFENIAIEIMQMVIGSIGILLAIPLTTVICAFLYNKKIKRLEN